MQVRAAFRSGSSCFRGLAGAVLTNPDESGGSTRPTSHLRCSAIRLPSGHAERLHWTGSWAPRLARWCSHPPSRGPRIQPERKRCSRADSNAVDATQPPATDTHPESAVGRRRTSPHRADSNAVDEIRPPVNAEECARLIGMGKSTFNKLAAREAWKNGDIPNPAWIGAGSGKVDRRGMRKGTRVWRVTTIEQWLIEHEYRGTK